MEDNQLNSSLHSQCEDTNLNDTVPKFDLVKNGIGSISPIELLEEVNNNLKDEEPIAEILVDNHFPIEAFPIRIQTIINRCNKDLGFPIEYVSAAMIYAVSVAIGNTRRIQIKNGWIESAVVYMAIVGPPGANKSHPISWILKPISDHDTSTYNKFQKEKKTFEKSLGLSKKEREKLGSGMGEKPVWKRLLLSDFTPEALFQVHKFNLRGIGVRVDELAGWIKNFGRYNKGSEEELWLSVWSCKPINIDRKSGDPVFINEPFISVIGGIQNGVLRELGKDGRMLNGFIDRMLFVFPDDVEKQYLSETEIDNVITSSWHGIISKLLKIKLPLDNKVIPDPKTLQFSPEAKIRFRAWHKEYVDQCNEAESEAISSIYSKMDMHVARLALIIEMMSWACGEGDKKAVSLKSVEGALLIVKYFNKSALKVHSIISKTNPLVRSSTWKDDLFKALPDTFNTSAGLLVALGLNVSERTFKRFLKDQELFTKIKHGEYKKSDLHN